MSSGEHLTVGGDNYVRITNLVRVDTDAVPGDVSSVTGKVLDNNKSLVGISISMTVVSGTTDAYEGTFSKSSVGDNLTDGNTYYVEVTVVASSPDLTKTKRQQMTANYTT